MIQNLNCFPHEIVSYSHEFNTNRVREYTSITYGKFYLPRHMSVSINLYIQINQLDTIINLNIGIAHLLEI